MTTISTRVTRHTVKRILRQARHPLTECEILDGLRGVHSGKDHVHLQQVLYQLYKAEVITLEGSPQGFVWRLNPDKESQD